MPRRPLKTLVLALPETAGSALYGLLDVLTTTGSIWQALLRSEVGPLPFNVQVASLGRRSFHCGNGIPVSPTISLLDGPEADIIVLPELWLGPDQHLAGRYPEVTDWIRQCYRAGTHIYSVCSASLLLAETGLLDGREATSHWGYQQLFERQYPRIRFRADASLCFADAAGRLVTAGGATSWHDMVLHIIARHASPVEALRIAKVYLLNVHAEGQLPYQPLVRPLPHADSRIRDCEAWLARHYRQANAVAAIVRHSRMPARTLKRRFRKATGLSVLDYLQNVRIEEAKRRLESSSRSADDISAEVGYQDASYFRRLFKRRTGMTPLHYRRMFQRSPLS
jgi:transcriptional regulator GlxA family with amidase domain